MIGYKNLAATSMLFLSMVAAGDVSNATTLTSDTLTNSVTYGFDFEKNLNYPDSVEVRSIGSVQMTWRSASLYGSVFDYFNPISLGLNGHWSSDPGGTGGVLGLAANTGPYQSMDFLFDSPLAGIGAFMNYSRFGSAAPIAVLNIYGVGDTLLETFDLAKDAPINTFGYANAGAFRGFQRNQADIVRLEVVGSIVMDNLVLSVPPPATVPLPSTGICLLAGLGVFTLFSRKRLSKGLVG